ncbi:long-chain-fatty-acid--CoA ligase [Streptomyces prunicolor]|uniref:long-chain-fatty-acid--CoA ligase n=1 Tax=Streptomyces prunicolor TaxID=67348 RepID=UPI00386CFD5F|nr:long-chain-fatty-acid--CoA ligase [Streptomyces prunicolor]
MSDSTTGTTPQLPGRGMTLADQLARHARTVGDEIAFRCAGAQRTYGEIDERVDRLANALRDRGVGPGDRVVVLGFNTLEVLEAYFATGRLGAICVPVNFRLVAHEIAYVLQDSGAAAVVVQDALAQTMDQARKEAGHTGPCLVFGAEHDGSGEDYEEALRSTSPHYEGAPVDERTPAFIMYTSGTTGRPKGAVLTHHNLLMHAFSVMTHLGLPPDDKVWLAATPLFHIAGLSGMLPTLMRGGRIVVLPSGGFDPSGVVDLLERERVSSCFFVPAQWELICAVPGIAERDLSALRRVAWGAAPATTTFLRKLIGAFPTASVETAFGQTESSAIVTMLRGDEALSRIGSVGTPLANVEVRVVDDELNDVPRGEIGEIVYRGPAVMAGYWNKPAETAEAFRGGWLHSGDLGRQDEDGYFYIVDRKKDMIISGGENIYCAEVENVLAAHPKVREVALIAVPDEKWGETPLAVVVAGVEEDPPTPTELVEWCAERLARYKHPRHIAVVPLLPRNPSGKVLKTQLRSDREAGRLDIRQA